MGFGVGCYYADCVEVLRRLASKLIWPPHRVRQAGPVPQGWPHDIAGPRPGINEVAAITRPPAPEPETWVKHPLDLDIGEVADGYHLIVRSISLTGANLLFESEFAPERAEGSGVWLNMSYGADIPASQDGIGAGGEFQYARPPLAARYAWFDFFRPDYDWESHFYGRWQPDDDYLRNRIARLTFGLKTGEAVIDK